MMKNRDLRWANPATAATYIELHNLAPRLAGLLYSPAIPEGTLQVILDWSKTVVSPEESSFSLDRIERLLPALVVGFIGEHAYARPDPGESGGHCVDLYDNGCGALVAEVLALVATITTTIHGETGRRLVAAARSDLARRLNRIADMIAGR